MDAGWIAEMRAQHQHSRVAAPGKEVAARRTRLLFVETEGAADVGLASLYGVVDHVSGDDRIVAFRRDADRAMTGCMARRPLQRHFIGDMVVELD